MQNKKKVQGAGKFVGRKKRDKQSIQPMDGSRGRMCVGREKKFKK
jgi:hypothetical protein